MLVASTFLGRRQQLEKGTDRKDTHKADIEALRVLGQFGAGKADPKPLQNAVDNVQSAADSGVPAAVAQGATRLQVLRKIHAWVTAWSDMARTVVTSRNELIKLGIAKRRLKKAKGDRAAARAGDAPGGDDPRGHASDGHSAHRDDSSGRDSSGRDSSGRDGRDDSSGGDYSACRDDSADGDDSVHACGWGLCDSHRGAAGGRRSGRAR